MGPDLFRHACLMGLEGLVSKHRDSLYRAGPLRSLGQGQEPAALRNGARRGLLLMTAALRRHQQPGWR
jgi:hypothetical protein